MAVAGQFWLKEEYVATILNYSLPRTAIRNHVPDHVEMTNAIKIGVGGTKTVRPNSDANRYLNLSEWVNIYIY